MQLQCLKKSDFRLLHVPRESENTPAGCLSRIEPCLRDHNIFPKLARCPHFLCSCSLAAIAVYFGVIQRNPRILQEIEKGGRKNFCLLPTSSDQNASKQIKTHKTHIFSRFLLDEPLLMSLADEFVIFGIDKITSRKTSM
jgi:hypothetical protein